jgi:hypothetical protein
VLLLVGVLSGTWRTARSEIEPESSV